MTDVIGSSERIPDEREMALTKRRVVHEVKLGGNHRYLVRRCGKLWVKSIAIGVVVMYKESVLGRLEGRMGVLRKRKVSVVVGALMMDLLRVSFAIVDGLFSGATKRKLTDTARSLLASEHRIEAKCRGIEVRGPKAKVAETNKTRVQT